jgi:hypothetical protein
MQFAIWAGSKKKLLLLMEAAFLYKGSTIGRVRFVPGSDWHLFLPAEWEKHSAFPWV